MKKQRPITSDAVQGFLQDGGKIEYRPIEASRGWHWELWAIRPDGSETIVISSKTGDDRVFKSADALVNFHLRTFPGSEGVWVPIPKGAEIQDAK